jgi:hypothetical protein
LVRGFKSPLLFLREGDLGDELRLENFFNLHPRLILPLPKKRHPAANRAGVSLLKFSLPFGTHRFIPKTVLRRLGTRIVKTGSQYSARSSIGFPSLRSGHFGMTHGRAIHSYDYQGKEDAMNNMYRRTFSLILIVISMSGRSVVAQSSGPAFSGYIESTYNYNFGKGATNALRSYDARANQILLNNVHIVASGPSSGKLSYAAEFDFGSDAAVHGLLHQGSGLPGPVAVDVQEAYVSYAFSEKFKFTGGKFVTFEGIEVIEGPLNPTISRGYLFGLAEPFTHVGGYLTLAASKAIELRLGVIDGWDLLVDNNADKTILSRLGVNLGDPLTFGIAFYSGVEQLNSSDARNSFDLTGVSKAIPGVTLNFQGNYGTETIGTTDATWYGFGVQPVIALSGKVDLGLRAEYFSDDDGARTGTADLSAFNLAVVPAYKADGMTFRFEYRFDDANKEVFVKDTGTSETSSTVSLGVSWNL